jgi:putative ABC transport system permease protein
MTGKETLGFAMRAVRRYPVRSGLVLLATAIGVAAVVSLTALSDAAGRFIRDELASLGTNLLIVLPGRSETSGGSPSMLLGQTPRDLTIEDALALRRIPAVESIVPMAIGSAPVSHGSRDREGAIIGATGDMLAVRRWHVASGRFLPAGDIERMPQVAVIGAKQARELFGPRSPLGEWIRIGDQRFRVIGVLATEGRSLDMDVEEAVLIPVGAALRVFNTASLFRILVEVRNRDALEATRDEIADLLAERHQGERDVTVITQDSLVQSFDGIAKAIGYSLIGVGAISLAVAGILIMNVMLVAVSQRTPEIGLLKALGARPRQILSVFLAEAVLLSVLGAVAGIALGVVAVLVTARLYPTLPLGVPVAGALAGFLTALTTGLIFGAAPARRAARLDPVAALSRR